MNWSFKHDKLDEYQDFHIVYLHSKFSYAYCIISLLVIIVMSGIFYSISYFTKILNMLDFLCSFSKQFMIDLQFILGL